MKDRSNRTSDIKILVTRPVAQSENFIHKLHEAGLQTIALPTIEITLGDASIDTALVDALKADIIIFTSLNAVNGAHCIKPLPWHTANQIAAIGEATAVALQNLRTSVDIKPSGAASSEALLNELGQVNNKNIAIIRGDSGRETLFNTLTTRGAEVRYYSVYKRSLPHYTLAELQDRFLSGLPDIISITSDLGLTHLIELIPPEFKSDLLQCPLVVNSKRCADYARQSGFTAEILIADPPGDAGQVPKISHMANKILTEQ